VIIKTLSLFRDSRICYTSSTFNIFVYSNGALAVDARVILEESS